VDLFRAGMGFNPAIDQDVAQVPKTGAIRFLERLGPARFAATEEIAQNVLPFVFRVYEARGYDFPILERYDRLWRREVAPMGPSELGPLLNVSLQLRDVTPRALRALRLLGVTHVLRATFVRPDAPPFEPLVPHPPLDVPGLRLVYDGPDARVYEVERALPRAFVAGGQQVIADPDAQLDAVTRPSFDGRRVAVTEERVEGVGEQPAAGGSARITTYEDERVVVRARAQRPGLLVLGDTYFPGWRATVDGREAPIERANYAFRGVRVGAGEHTVEFRYEPLSWRLGWITSLVSLLGLAAAVVVGRRRGRHRARAPEPAAASAAADTPAREPDVVERR